MKNILARGGIEFLAVLLGISGSLWIDGNQENRKKKEHQDIILESIYNDIIQTEKFFKESTAKKHFPAIGDATLCGVIVECNIKTGLTNNIQSYIYGNQFRN